MNNWSIALLFIWIMLAILNVVGIWISMPVLNISFGIMNMAIIFSLIPLLIQEIRVKIAENKNKKNNEL